MVWIGGGVGGDLLFADSIACGGWMWSILHLCTVILRGI